MLHPVRFVTRSGTVPTRAALALAGMLVALLLGSATARAEPAPAFTNPVIAGQYPDPTVLRDGTGFFLSTTSRSWAPLFPLFRSPDLVNWEQIGSVLPRPPAWASAPFWAPELTRWGAETRVYYTARLRSDRSRACIGVARATAPAGPYRDLGRPLTCPPDGAIDAFVTRDEHDAPYLVYRRFHGDGGIWARQLSEDGLRVRGEAKLLLPLEPDDGGVVEGPTVVRRDGGFVLLFAAGDCCKPPCDYREAAARAPALLGPYERAPGLVLEGSGELLCPGHGTLVDDGRGGDWLLHHGVLADDPANARRNTLLDPVVWGEDGWPRIGADGLPLLRGTAPLGVAQRPPPPLTPNLRAAHLDRAWEWPWDLPARTRQRDGRITLGGEPRGALLARQVAPLDVRAQVRVPSRGCVAGIAGVPGDEDSGQAYGIELTRRGGRTLARAWQGDAAHGAGRTLATATVGSNGPAELALDIRDARTLRFSVRAVGGRWRTLPAIAATGPNRRLLRIALTCRGPRATSATFDALRIAPSRR
jgi:hypothetical protein